MAAKHDVREVTMEEALWGLFENYVRLLNRRLRARGLPRVSKGQALGAVASRFLLAHRSQIMGEHAELEVEKRLGVSVRGGSHGLDLPSAADLLAAAAPEVPVPRRARPASPRRR